METFNTIFFLSKFPSLHHAHIIIWNFLNKDSQSADLQCMYVCVHKHTSIAAIHTNLCTAVKET